MAAYLCGAKSLVRNDEAASSKGWENPYTRN